MPNRRRRPLVRLTVVALVAGVGLAAAPAALSFALDAQPKHAVVAVRPVTPASPVAKSIATAVAKPLRTPTTIRGWRSAPKTVRAGQVYRAKVRATGAHRVIRLERLVHGAWKVVDRERSGGAGRAMLTWRATRAGHPVLRVHVLRTAGRTAAVTARRTITVRPLPTATASPAPVASTPTSTATTSMPTASTTPSGSTTTASATPAPSASTPATAAEQLRQQLFTLVNEARATARTCGSASYPAAPALTRSDALDRAAGDYALKMATEDFFAHESPDGSTMVSRLQAVGIGNTTERENIAAGQTSAASVMQGWLQSPGHCANLMAADVTRIGLGHATGTSSTYGQYWVQDFAG